MNVVNLKELESKIAEVLPHLKYTADATSSYRGLTLHHKIDSIKPITLSEILLYAKKNDCNINDATNDSLCIRKGEKYCFWDLHENRLEGQDEEVIKFLNEL